MDDDVRAMTTEDDDGAGGAAVPCEAVEFEDLFANPIAQGSNLEFRVSRVTGGGANDAVVEGNAVVKKSEVVCEREVVETEGLVQVDVKAEEVIDVMEEERDAFQVVSDDVKVDYEEPDGRVALNKLELHSKTLDSQVGELQRIVTLQYRLTGANPLEQELVRIFEALSVLFRS